MPAAAALALLLLIPNAPAPELKGPAITFLKIAEVGMLTFELSNPNAGAVPYVGYLSESFEGGLKEGTIAPLFRVEVRRGKEWKAYPIGWCGTGLGKVSVPGKGKVTFKVALPDGDWDIFRVGVTWYKTAERKESAVTWSDALTKEDVAPKKP